MYKICNICKRTNLSASTVVYEYCNEYIVYVESWNVSGRYSILYIYRRVYSILRYTTFTRLD